MADEPLLNVLERELLVLKKIPAIDRVRAYPKDKVDAKLNNNGVTCRIAVGDAFQTVNVHCSLDHGIFTKLDAARAVKANISKIVGEADVRSAELMVEQQLAGAGPSLPPFEEAAPPSAEELEWLANWYDEHDDPSVATLAEAEAALNRRRREQGGEDALVHLMETSALQAKVRAAQRRVEKAQLELRRAEEAALPPVVEPAQKRARQREPRPYDDWAPEEWIRHASWVWTRRQEVLSPDAAGRLPDKMPRGERAGPLHHWQRGLVGAVQDWAEGSMADAAKLVFALIKELHLEVRLPLAGFYALSAPPWSDWCAVCWATFGG